MDFLENILRHVMVERLGWMLVHFVWQAGLIALILGFGLKVLSKSSANLRYIAGCGALIAVGLLPVVTISLIPAGEAYIAEEGIEIVETAEAVETVEAVAVPIKVEPVEIEVGLVGAMPVIEEAALETEEAVVEKIAFSNRVAGVLEPALPYMVVGWAFGVFGLSVWYLGGWTQLQRMRRRMVKPVEECLRQRLGCVADKLGVGRAVEVFESALVVTPTVVGWLKPVILLPASVVTGFSGEQIEAILAHELAHIKRCDYLVNMLQTCVEILGFYHPAVWWISKKIRVERENCCDDIAVKVCGDRIGYAKTLALFEGIRPGQSQLAVAASGSSLFERICRLIQKDSSGVKVDWKPSVIAVLLVIALLIPAGFALTGGEKKGSDPFISRYHSEAAKELLIRISDEGKLSDKDMEVLDLLRGSDIGFEKQLKDEYFAPSGKAVDMMRNRAILGALGHLGTSMARETLIDIACRKHSGASLLGPRAVTELAKLTKSADEIAMVLRSPDLNTRNAAAGAMANKPLSAAVVEALSKQLSSKSWYTHYAVAMAFGTDTSEDHAAKKIDALLANYPKLDGRIDDTDSTIYGSTTTPTEMARGCYVDALSKMKGARMELVRRMAKASADQREALILALGRRGVKSIRPELLEIARNSKDGYVRKLAVYGMYDIATKDDMDFLRQLSLNDPYQKTVTHLDINGRPEKYYPVRNQAKQVLEQLKKRRQPVRMLKLGNKRGQAIKEYEAVYEQKHAFFKLPNQGAKKKSNRPQRDRVIDAYSKLIERYPLTEVAGWAREEILMLYGKSDDMAGAEESYKELVETLTSTKHEMTAHNYMGRLWLGKGSPEKAIKYFKAIPDPRREPYRLGMPGGNVPHSKNDGAIGVEEEYYALATTKVLECYIKMGMVEEANRQKEKFIKAYPERAEMIEKAVQKILKQAKKVSEALKSDVKDRSIYFKLPLAQPRFHWKFTDRDEYLSGKLVLRVISGVKVNEIVVFDQGKVSQGWKIIPCDRGPKGNSVYFGFISSALFPVSPEDKVEIVLDAKQDLAGIGRLQTGILKAGTHKASGKFKIGVLDQEKSFIEWDDKWLLDITSEKGWWNSHMTLLIEENGKMRPLSNAEKKRVYAAAKFNSFFGYVDLSLEENVTSEDPVENRYRNIRIRRAYSKERIDITDYAFSARKQVRGKTTVLAKHDSNGYFTHRIEHLDKTVFVEDGENTIIKDTLRLGRIDGKVGSYLRILSYSYDNDDREGNYKNAAVFANAADVDKIRLVDPSNNKVLYALELSKDDWGLCRKIQFYDEKSGKLSKSIEYLDYNKPVEFKKMANRGDSGYLLPYKMLCRYFDENGNEYKTETLKIVDAALASSRKKQNHDAVRDNYEKDLLIEIPDDYEIIDKRKKEIEISDSQIVNGVTEEGWEVVWRGKKPVETKEPRFSIYVKSINEIEEGVELRVDAVFSRQKDIPLGFRPVAIDKDGKTITCNQKVTRKQSDDFKTLIFHAPFKGIKLNDIKEFQLQFQNREKTNYFSGKNSTDKDGWTTKWHGKTPEIADMPGGSVLGGIPKYENGQLTIDINDTFYDGTTSRIIVIDNNDRIHTGKQTSKYVPEREYRTTEVTFANIRLEDVKEFKFQIRPQGVTIDLSPKWRKFDSDQTVQLYAAVANESNKELLITGGEYDCRLIVDFKEYRWNPEMREVRPSYMRMNKGDIHEIVFTIDEKEWRNVKDGREFLELGPGRHRVQVIAIPHPQSEFKEKIYSNTAEFSINNDKSAAKGSDTLNPRSEEKPDVKVVGKVTERKWSDSKIDFRLRVIEPTGQTPFIAEITIANRTDEMQSVPWPSIMPQCGDTNKNNIRVFDKDNKPLKMHGLHADGPSRGSAEIGAKSSKTWSFRLETWFPGMANPGTYLVEPWYFSEHKKWSSWVGRVEMQPLTVVRKEWFDVDRWEKRHMQVYGLFCTYVAGKQLPKEDTTGTLDKHPKLYWSDIPSLLEFAEYEKVIKDVPKLSISSYHQNEGRRGMVALWLIDALRKQQIAAMMELQGANGRITNEGLGLNPICIKENLPIKECENSREIHKEVLELYRRWWRTVAEKTPGEAAIFDPLELSDIQWFGRQHWEHSSEIEIFEEVTEDGAAGQRIICEVVHDDERKEYLPGKKVRTIYYALKEPAEARRPFTKDMLKVQKIVLHFYDDKGTNIKNKAVFPSRKFSEEFKKELKGSDNFDSMMVILPRTPIRSINEYHHSYRSYASAEERSKTSYELWVVSSDYKKLVRIGGVGSSGEYGGVQLNQSQQRRAGKLEDGKYLVAVYSKGVRCSNIAEIEIDSDFDASGEPVLTLVPLPLAGGQKLPLLGIRAVGPTPQDPELRNDTIAFPKLVVDGVERNLTAIDWSGPIMPLKSGQVYTRIRDLNGYDPAIEPGRKHTIKAIVGKYESETVVIPADTKAYGKFDAAMQKLAPLPPPKAVVEGTVTGFDGKAGAGFVVNLFRKNDTSGVSAKYRETTGKDGKYRFENIPSGEYELVCHYGSEARPDIKVKKVIVDADKTSKLDLSLQTHYNITGRVFYEDGRGAAKMDVTVVCGDLEGNLESDNITWTDADGKYQIGVPFGNVGYIGVNGGRVKGQMPKLEASGTVLNYVLKKNKYGKYSGYPVLEAEKVSDSLNFGNEISWGEAVGGLELGLQREPGEDGRVKTLFYRPGDLVDFRVYVRNVSDKSVTLVHNGTMGLEPTVSSPGRQYQEAFRRLQKVSKQKQVSLLPGEIKELGPVYLQLGKMPELKLMRETPELGFYIPNIQPRHLPDGSYEIEQKFSFVKSDKADFHGELTSGKVPISFLSKWARRRTDFIRDKKEHYWGIEVEGLQLGLKGKGLKVDAGDQIILDIYLRNRGERDWSIYWKRLYGAYLKVDGDWYRKSSIMKMSEGATLKLIRSGSTDSGPFLKFKLAAGENRQWLRDDLSDKYKKSTGKPAYLNLKPGRHEVQLYVPAMPFKGESYISDFDEKFGIPSIPVEIEVLPEDKPVFKITPESADSVWKELGGDDQGDAYRAVKRLCSAGDAGVELIAKRIEPDKAGEGPFAETTAERQIARSIRALELIGSTAAKKQLNRIIAAGGDRWPSVFARAALIRLEKQPSGPSVETFGSNRGMPIYDGYVFFDGKYIPAPYVVERWGADVYINGALVRRGYEDSFGVTFSDKIKAMKEQDLSSGRVVFYRTGGGRMDMGKKGGIELIESLLGVTPKDPANPVKLYEEFTAGFESHRQLIQRLVKLEGRKISTTLNTLRNKEAKKGSDPFNSRVEVKSSVSASEMGEIREMLSELAKRPEHVDPKIPADIKERIVSGLPRSADVLLSVMENPKDKLHRRAVLTLVELWEKLTPEQVEEFFKLSISVNVESRKQYPQGVGTGIGAHYSNYYGQEGRPKVKNIKIRTVSKKYLDGIESGRVVDHEGWYCGLGWIYIKYLEAGKHTMKVVTEYVIDYKGRTFSGKSESELVEFEIVKDAPNKLAAPYSKEVEEKVKRCLTFKETDEPVMSYRRPFWGWYQDPWEPQYSSGRRQGHDEYALHLPLYSLSEPLDVDLCFNVDVVIEETGEKFKCYSLTILKGEKCQNRRVEMRQNIKGFVEGRDGFVPVKVVLTPSYKTALSDMRIKNYYNGSITSQTLRAKVFHFAYDSAEGWEKELYDMFDALEDKDKLSRDVLWKLTAMGSLNPYQRRYAASYLNGSIKGKNHRVAIPFLVKLLNGGEGISHEGPGRVKRHTADTARETLERIGKRAVEELIKGLKDNNDSGGGLAAQALGNIGDKRALKPLAEVLKDGGPRSRMVAARVVGKFKDPGVVDILIGLLKDEDGNVRAGAAASLAGLGDKRAVKAFVDCLDDANNHVRQSAVEGLASMEPVESVELFFERLKKDDNDIVRRVVIEKLAGIEDSRIAGQLTMAAFKDKSGEVRAAAVKALSGKKGKDAMDVIIKCLEDPSGRVRTEAVNALTRINDPGCVKLLVKALKDKEQNVRHVVILALGKSKSPEAVEPLIEVMKTDEVWLRANAVLVLGKLGDRRAVEPVIELLKHKESELRYKAARTLGELKDPRAIGPLKAVLDDKDASVRNAAKTAIALIEKSMKEERSKEQEGLDSGSGEKAELGVDREGGKTEEGVIRTMASSSFDLDAAANLVGTVGGNWQKVKLGNAGDALQARFSVLTTTRPNGSPLVIKGEYLVLPYPFNSSGQKKLAPYTWPPDGTNGAMYRVLGANEKCTVLTNVWPGGRASQKVSQAISKVLKLSPPEVTARSLGMANRLTRKIDTFKLVLRAPDSLRNKILSLSMIVTTEREVPDRRPDQSVVQISKQQARRIIDHLTKDGFFDRSVNIMQVATTRPHTADNFTIWALDGGLDTAENLRGNMFVDDMELDIDTLVSLGQLRKILKGNAAEAMDKFMANFNTQRQQWEKEETKVSDTLKTPKEKPGKVEKGPLGKVVRLTVNPSNRDYIDLDTGKVFSYPGRIVLKAGEKAPWEKNEEIDLRFGIFNDDFCVFTDMMEAAAVPDDKWNCTEEELMLEIKKARWTGDRQLAKSVWDKAEPDKYGKVPGSTFVFRTNKGAVGVMQIMGVVRILKKTSESAPRKAVVRRGVISKYTTKQVDIRYWLVSKPTVNVSDDEVLWGSEVDGIVCGVRPVKRSFSSGESFGYEILYKNVSSKPVTVCIYPDRLYIWTQLKIIDTKGRIVSRGMHANGLKRPLKLSDFATLKPGETASVRGSMRASSITRLASSKNTTGEYAAVVSISGINRMDKYIPKFHEFCKKNNITPWVGVIESGPGPFRIIPSTEKAK